RSARQPERSFCHPERKRGTSHSLSSRAEPTDPVAPPLRFHGGIPRSGSCRTRDDSFCVARAERFHALSTNGQAFHFRSASARFPRPPRIELGLRRPALHLVLHVPIQSPDREQSDQRGIRLFEIAHGLDYLHC